MSAVDKSVDITVLELKIPLEPAPGYRHAPALLRAPFLADSNGSGSGGVGGSSDVLYLLERTQLHRILVPAVTDYPSLIDPSFEIDTRIEETRDLLYTPTVTHWRRNPDWPEQFGGDHSEQKKRTDKGDSGGRSSGGVGYALGCALTRHQLFAIDLNRGEVVKLALGSTIASYVPSIADGQQQAAARETPPVLELDEPWALAWDRFTETPNSVVYIGCSRVVHRSDLTTGCISTVKAPIEFVAAGLIHAGRHQLLVSDMNTSRIFLIDLRTGALTYLIVPAPPGDDDSDANEHSNDTPQPPPSSDRSEAHAIVYSFREPARMVLDESDRCLYVVDTVKCMVVRFELPTAIWTLIES